MRQAGILAAAGIYALDNNVERMVDDHRNAIRLAEQLKDISRIKVDLDEVQTNMVFIEFENGVAPTFRKFMEQKGILLGADWNNVIRLVTHLNCQKTDVDLFASEAKSFFE